jgi:hypothetical protein
MSQAAQEQTIARIRKALELNRRKMTVQVAREKHGGWPGAFVMDKRA